MKAVIMAGGKGTRLESLTKGEIPKPMIPIKEKPLLLWQIEELKRYGIVDITMIIWSMPDLFQKRIFPTNKVQFF